MRQGEQHLLPLRQRLLAFRSTRRLLWYMKMVRPEINTQKTRVQWLPRGQGYVQVARLSASKIVVGPEDGHYRYEPLRVDTVHLRLCMWGQNRLPYYFMAAAEYDKESDTLFVSDWNIERKLLGPAWNG